MASAWGRCDFSANGGLNLSLSNCRSSVMVVLPKRRWPKRDVFSRNEESWGSSVNWIQELVLCQIHPNQGRQ